MRRSRTTRSARAPGSMDSEVTAAERAGPGVAVTVRTADGTPHSVQAIRLRTAWSSGHAARRAPRRSCAPPLRRRRRRPSRGAHCSCGDRSDIAATASVTAAGRSGPRERRAIATRDGIDVHAVGDQAGDDPRVGERSADRARVAVAERSHRGVQVGHHRRRPSAGRGELARAAVGVPDRRRSPRARAARRSPPSAPGSSAPASRGDTAGRRTIRR